jgi:SAM-dependent methyltransferase
MTSSKQGGEGSSPLVHLSLLALCPERVLALRLALASVVGQASSVLDAGCGSLGVLAILAAKLGAQRVVGIDFGGPLTLAEALAKENGVADRVRFIEGDLADMDRPIGTFDVIVAMVYNNEPRRDLVQQRLVSRIAQRFGHPGTSVIPDRVLYTVSGYDSVAEDKTGRTASADWQDSIRRVEGQTGLSLARILPLVDPEWRKNRLGLDVPWPSEKLPARFGYADRRPMTLLTRPETFVEIDYSRPETALTYPSSLNLAVIRAGQLDTTIWRQDLLFGEVLIRSTETVHPIAPATQVGPGDTVALAVGDSWEDAIPLAVQGVHR